MSFFFVVVGGWLASGLLMVVSFLTTYAGLFSSEKSSPFECGFDSISAAHSVFSLRFFVLCVVFLIFDVELSLLIPLGVAFLLGGTLLGLMFGVFLVMLGGGTLYETSAGALSWMK